MFAFGEKHPVLFELLLILAAFLAAAVFTAAGSILYLHPELSASIGRIAVGAALLVIYKRAFKRTSPFHNPGIVLLALLFAVWNVFYNLSSGMVFGGRIIFTEALITALAPAVFEEVIFRGIFIYNLRKKGHGDMSCLLISSAVFAAVHLTNLVGQPVATVALQVVYSLVVGMVFSAVYLKNGSILQVIAAHFLIDFTNRIYVEQTSSASTWQLILFVLLLIAEAVYAILLTRPGKNEDSEMPA